EELGRQGGRRPPGLRRHGFRESHGGLVHGGGHADRAFLLRHMNAAERWLADFEAALRAADDASLAKLFRADAHWRDLLAFTWQVKTVSWAGAILPELKRRAERGGRARLPGEPRR